MITRSCRGRSFMKLAPKRLKSNGFSSNESGLPKRPGRQSAPRVRRAVFASTHRLRVLIIGIRRVEFKAPAHATPSVPCAIDGAALGPAPSQAVVLSGRGLRATGFTTALSARLGNPVAPRTTQASASPGPMIEEV